MLRGSTNDKIIRILKRMDEVLSKNNFFQYQERIHRIYKTLVSIERHEGCFVSNFNPDGDNQEEFTVNYIKEQDNEIANSLSLNDEGDIDEENDQNGNKLGLGNLFDFIEDELNLKNLVSIEDSTVYSSSDDEDSLEKESPKEHKAPYKPILDNMQKNFFNIELRLRAYLKEQEIFKNYSFDSILNESKLKTPISKIDPNRNVLPAIVRNFFEDKEIIEAAKKRYSVREELRSQLEMFGKAEELVRCKSHRDQMKMSANTQNVSSNISSFSIDNLEVNNNPAERNSLTVLKRGSIFKEKYIFNDFPTVNEEANSADSSCRSDEEGSEENDSSYVSEYESGSYESEYSKEDEKKSN